MPRKPARCVGAFAAAVVCAMLLGANATSPPAEAPDRAGPGTHGRVLIVPIHGPIDRVQGAFLHRTLGNVKGRYDAVVFDIDTPGGRIDIMSKMSDDIVKVSPTPTIAFVSKWAVSAGSFIAMSADRIYMAPTAIIGAAHGYLPGPDGLPVQLPKDVAEKFASVNRAQFRALAQSKGYPPAIAEAMTDKDIEVTKVIYEGKTQYLTGEELAKITSDPLEKDKLKVIEVVSPKGKLITFTAEEARRFDLARKVIHDLDAVLKEEGLSSAKQIKKEQSWSDTLIGILTSPQIVGLLVLIGFGGVWLELKMPGFGVPGTIAVIAFLLVFGSQFLVGNANAAEILLFIVGLALLAIELFVTPGFGVIGGAGIGCVFLSLVLAMQPFTVPSAPWEFQALKLNLIATASGVGGSFVLLLFFAWFLPNTSVFRRLTLRKELTAEEGFSSGVQEGETLTGQVGTVVTALRPAGKLEIGDKTYSVVSDAEFVEAGRKAQVIRVDGPKIVVEPVEPEAPKEPSFQA